MKKSMISVVITIGVIVGFSSLSWGQVDADDAALGARMRGNPFVPDGPNGPDASQVQIKSMMQCSGAGDTLSDPKVKALLAKCRNSAQTAGYACIESLSPKIQGGLAVISGLASGLSVMSPNQACSKKSEIYEVAKGVLGAYNLACGGLQWACESDCKDALVAIEKVVPVETTPGSRSADKEFARTSAVQCESVCSGYKWNLAAGAASIAALVKKVSDAKKCESDTEAAKRLACQANPLAPGCTQKTDCSKTENATLVECICLKSPRATGCPGADTGNRAGSEVVTTAAPKTGTAEPKVADPNIQVTQDLAAKSSGGFSGSAGPGGLAGVGGGSSGPAAAQKGGGADGTKGSQKLATDILDSSGSGGGGGWRTSGGGGYDSRSNLRAYMPGGSKDPSRNPSSQTVLTKEVTGAGGEDNWKKVSDRYRDNKPTLKGD